MSGLGVVYLVDDDRDVRDSVSMLLLSAGLDPEAFESVAAFEEGFDEDRAGCVVTDVRLPLRSGFDLLDRLRGAGCGVPVIVFSGHADVPMAKRAVREGVVEFFEKPFNDQELIDAVNRALEISEQEKRSFRALHEKRALFETMSVRECDVVHLLARGMKSSEIAGELGLSARTVEMHRTRIMKKLDVRTAAELVSFYVRLGYGDSADA